MERFLYQKLLAWKSKDYLPGTFYFVSQELSVHIDSEEIFYWTSKNEAEVDFIVPIGSKIFPLEVKGGLSRRIKSLRVYTEKYNPSSIFRTSPRNFTCDSDFTNIPLYAISLLPGYQISTHPLFEKT